VTQQKYIIAAAAGSLALMLGAFAFQNIGGMAPCKLCIWQRYPHVIAILLGLLALTFENAKLRTLLILAGAVSTATTAVIGIYHAGVEQGIFEGPTSCTSGSIDKLSADDLLNQIMSAPMVRCDDIPWQLVGISMAGWNAIISLVLCALWLMALKRR
jgi:disulfide bond formation protein DsbB